MATVNFQCGNCNKLMAVGAEHLGQQVRCPHCQAVVVAPSAAPQPAPAPAAGATETLPFSPRANDQEDIFAPPEPADDLFGQPEAPRVELPAPAPEPSPPTLALDPPFVPAPPADGEAGASTAAYAGTPPAAPGDGAGHSWMDAAHAPAHSPLTGDAGPAHDEALPQMAVRKPRDGGGLFIGMVFIPLVSYAVLVSILAGWLFYVNTTYQAATPQKTSPLEDLPSFDPNDEQHSTHLKTDAKTFNRARGITMTLATAPLPPHQVIPLGQKLTLGDLEVEPERVERRKVSVMVEGFKNAEPCRYPSLVLHLKLRNVSDNVVFQPMDDYFTRKWEPKPGAQPPLTMLELQDGDRTTRFLGGPAVRPPPSSSAAEGDNPPEWVDGTNYDRVLNPGEEMETFVCTDGGKKDGDEGKAVAKAVDDHHGKLLWRVHLRRGVVVRDAHHYVPVSTVIGVEFTDEAYRKSS